MPAVQAKRTLSHRLMDNIAVRVEGYTYLVDFGFETKPRFHSVLKNGCCTCVSGASCPAVEVVREYRKAGGEQAPEPPADYYMIAPDKCPLCGARAFATGLLHPEKGIEWECSANLWHYRQHHLKLVLQMRPHSPWRFPPVVMRNGIQINAWDGANSDDRMLYPGVLEKDVTGVATDG